MAGLRAFTSTKVEVPRFAPWLTTIGWVHLGTDAAFRAVQAVYLDRVLGTGNLEWGGCVVGLASEDRSMVSALQDQDSLYSVLTHGRDGQRQARVVAAVIEHIHAPANPPAVQARLVSASTRVVSLPQVDDSPDQRVTTVGSPVSAIGHVVAALSARRAAGVGPFTVLSLDVAARNGDRARDLVMSAAAATDPGLARWIAGEVTFPNSVVPSLSTVTTEWTREVLADEFGVADAWPVEVDASHVNEAAASWVVEDRFCAGRPPLELAGVVFIDSTDGIASANRHDKDTRAGRPRTPSVRSSRSPKPSDSGTSSVE